MEEGKIFSLHFHPRVNLKSASQVLVNRTPGPRARLHASRDPELSQLWRGDFFGFAAVSILRVEAGYGGVPFVLCHDVRGQQTLPALRRCHD